MAKNPPANAGDARDRGSIPGLGRSTGGGHGNPLQCSCLENLLDRGTRRSIVHRAAKSHTRLKQLSLHISSLFSDSMIITYTGSFWRYSTELI